MEDQRHNTPFADKPNLLPYANSIGSPPIKPTEEGVIRGKALKSMEEQVKKQFSQLQKQYELLVNQSLELKRRTDISYLIYNSQIKFEPVVSEVYHLYRKNNQDFLSLIEPELWKNKNIQWIATVKLLADHTWDIIEMSENYSDYFNI